MDGNRRKGLLIILSSPSGAGKTTLARKLTAWDPTIEFSVSMTTRQPRKGEKSGREYHFCSNSEFDEMVGQDAFLEYAEVFGNLYGSPREPIESAIKRSRDVVFDIDWQGGLQIKNSMFAENAVSIFILPPSIKELKRRLHTRGKDSEKSVERRMVQAKDEIQHWTQYDYVLINNCIENVCQKIQQIVLVERMRRSRSTQLSQFVEKLIDEYQDRYK